LTDLLKPSLMLDTFRGTAYRASLSNGNVFADFGDKGFEGIIDHGEDLAPSAAAASSPPFSAFSQAALSRVNVNSSPGSYAK
jgi:hypothetical protein